MYAIVLQWPGETLHLASIRPREGTAVTMLGVKDPLKWRMADGEGLIIEIPRDLQPVENRPCKQAWAFRIEPDPTGG